MQKISVFMVGIGLLLLANAAIVAGASHPKVEELNRKITEMASLESRKLLKDTFITRL